LFDGIGDELEPSDILEITDGTAKIHNKLLHLHIARPGGTALCTGQFTLPFVEHPNLSLLTWSHDPNSASGWVRPNEPPHALPYPCV